jgi:hypothetical protein
MANKANKHAKRQWKIKVMAHLLSEALLKGEVCAFDHDLREQAIHFFKRKYVYGKAKPYRKTWQGNIGRKVRRIGQNRIIVQKTDGKYILAPTGGGRLLRPIQ